MNISRITIALLACLVCASLLVALAPAGAQTTTTQPTATRPAAGVNSHNAARGPARGDSTSVRSEKGPGAEEEGLPELLKERMPDRYAALQELKTSNPQSYGHMVSMMSRIYQRWKDAPVNVQEAALRLLELQTKIYKVAEKARTASDADKPALLTELRNIISKQLDDEHMVNLYRLTEIETRLSELRAELKQQEDQRPQVAAERLESALQATTTRKVAGQGGSPKQPSKPSPTSRPTGPAGPN